MTDNGTPVTWREFNLFREPLIRDLAEIKGDVKTLLAAHAGSEALSGWQRWFFGSVIIASLGAIATLVWLAVAG